MIQGNETLIWSSRARVSLQGLYDNPFTSSTIGGKPSLPISIFALHSASFFLLLFYHYFLNATIDRTTHEVMNTEIPSTAYTFS